MRVNATAGVGNHAGGTPLPPVGKPYYDPAWGRWMVRLGGGFLRTADLSEIPEVEQAPQADGCKISQSTDDDKGK